MTSPRSPPVPANLRESHFGFNRTGDNQACQRRTPGAILMGTTVLTALLRVSYSRSNPVIRRWMANAIGPARAFFIAYKNFFPNAKFPSLSYLVCKTAITLCAKGARSFSKM